MESCDGLGFMGVLEASCGEAIFSEGRVSSRFCATRLLHHLRPMASVNLDEYNLLNAHMSVAVRRRQKRRATTYVDLRSVHEIAHVDLIYGGRRRLVDSAPLLELPPPLLALSFNHSASKAIMTDVLDLANMLILRLSTFAHGRSPIASR